LRRPEVKSLVATLWRQAESSLVASLDIRGFGGEAYVARLCERANGNALAELLSRPPMSFSACVTLQHGSVAGWARLALMAFFMQYVEVARQFGAVVDLAVTFVQVDELGRGGEIVAVGVQFVEQIHQVVRRGAAPTVKVCLHIAIIALELARNLARRIKARHQMLARHGAARNQG
jgi:hypothetical protein